MEKFKPQPVEWAQVDRFLAGAQKKLASARKIMAFDEEASLQQAYEAMLKASIGFTFSHGVRARGIPGHRIAIVEFVEKRLDKKYAGLMAVFDRLRRKRNAVLYDDDGFVSRKEAQQALASARELIDVVRADIEVRKSTRIAVHSPTNTRRPR